MLVTVNVLMKEAELGRLVDMLSALEALEVDAIIVQVYMPLRRDFRTGGAKWSPLVTT